MKKSHARTHSESTEQVTGETMLTHNAYLCVRELRVCAHVRMHA